jgi:hypothetical protein
MEPATAERMIDEFGYEEPDANPEDPNLTPQGRWRMVLPVGLLVVLPLLGIYGLRETVGDSFWPSHNAWMHGTAPSSGAVGTSGAATETSDKTNAEVIRDVETITGLSEGHPLVGRHVELHVPIAGQANDQAFWIGSNDNRVLVVPNRDRRDGAERQEGLLAGNAIDPLQAGDTAIISGSIQKLPQAEGRFNWGLTKRDEQEVAVSGVYLRADTVTVQ